MLVIDTLSVAYRSDASTSGDGTAGAFLPACGAL